MEGNILDGEIGWMDTRARGWDCVVDLVRINGGKHKNLLNVAGSAGVTFTRLIVVPLWIGFTMVGATVRCAPFDSMLVVPSAAGFAEIATKLTNELFNLSKQKTREENNTLQN